MNHILVITNGESDLLYLLSKHCKITVRSFDDTFNSFEYDALCILGGNEGTAKTMSAHLHNFVEEMHGRGKLIFFEYVSVFLLTRSKGTLDTTRERMVYREDGLICSEVANGDILYGQSNACIKYGRMVDSGRPILTYREHVCAHSNINIAEDEHRDGTFALWWYDDKTLVSSIRLSNFHRARFAPKKRWQSIIAGIVSFLTGEKVVLEFPLPVCSYSESRINSSSDASDVIRLGIDWIEKSEILKNGGHGGAREGFSNRISAKDGTHNRNSNIRADCTNEIGGALMLDALICDNEKSLEYANALFDFAFENFQIKSGEHKGMLRWSEGGWYDCYQDDVARATVPLLLCRHFGVPVPHFDDICAALDYLVCTTAKDGIRVPCTQIGNMSEDFIKKITGDSAAEPCAHFNAFYHAALLLAFLVCGDKRYLECAERGLETLMSAFPETRRETSETEEYCRLVFPLAVLYGVTEKKEHYAWLNRVVDGLRKFRHPSGGYAEWDTGYKAGCSRNHEGECALLADNGDPVADLLYSNNWLPLGFAYAYYVTGEKKFYDLWCGVASFIASAQMHSDLPNLNGAWARAFDMDTRENYGMPHDKGWGPQCIESGWTVGEILIGLQFMHAAESKWRNRNNF